MVSGGCEKVLSHPSSSWFGIPVAYFGLLGYLSLTALAATRAVMGLEKTKLLITAAYVISGVGTLASVFLQYEALAVIREFCPYCFASAVTMTATFVFTAMLANRVTALERTLPVSAKTDVTLISGLTVAVVIMLVLGYTKIRTDNKSLVASVHFNSDVELIPADAHIYGAKESPITLIEFSDLLCPKCQETTPKVIDFINNHVGKIRLVYRHFPLNRVHPMANVAAITAEYASEKLNFFDFSHSMMSIKDAPTEPERIFSVAKSNGVDVEDLKKRLQDANDPIYGRVQRDRAAASGLGVTGTPTFFIMLKGETTQPQVVSANELFDVLGEPKYTAVLNGK